MWICRWVYPGVWESSGQWVFKSGSVSVLCPAVGLSRCLGVWVWGIQMSGYLSAGYLCTNTLVFESGHRLSCARGVCVFRCVYLQERGVHLLDGKCPGDCALELCQLTCDTPFPGACLPISLQTPRLRASEGGPRGSPSLW